MTINETIQRFDEIFLLNGGNTTNSRNDFYCGITDDIERRQKEHCILKFLTYTTCDSFETAKTLERKLHELGYDTGKQLGNGNENSIFVYIYKKIPGVTKE